MIESLESRGHAVFHEYSRQLIQESLAAGTDVLPWDNLDAFTEAVLAKRWEHYCAVEAHASAVFYDRTPMDALAYYGPDPASWHSDWMAVCERSLYHTVFITPPWREIYTVDQERWETFEHVEEVHSHLVATYRYFGYDPVLVPFGTLEERVLFIEHYLELNTANI